MCQKVFYNLGCNDKNVLFRNVDDSLSDKLKNLEVQFAQNNKVLSTVQVQFKIFTVQDMDSTVQVQYEIYTVQIQILYNICII